MRNNVSQEERQDIISCLKEKSQCATARLFKRSSGTINKIAQEENILPLNVYAQKTKAATKARRYYAKEDRLDVLEEALDKTRELLKTIDKASQAREIATAIAIIIDKFRLELGESTSRNEVLDVSDAKAQLRELLHVDEHNQPLESDNDTNSDSS